MSKSPWSTLGWGGTLSRRVRIRRRRFTIGRSLAGCDRRAYGLCSYLCRCSRTETCCVVMKRALGSLLRATPNCVPQSWARYSSRAGRLDAVDWFYRARIVWAEVELSHGTRQIPLRKYDIFQTRISRAGALFSPRDFNVLSHFEVTKPCMTVVSICMPRPGATNRRHSAAGFHDVPVDDLPCLGG